MLNLAWLLACIALICGACSSPPRTPAGPYVVVLGTAQDGGVPQIGCDQPRCVRARRDSSARRLVTSLLLADPRSGRRWLFDASPDLASQVERARAHPPTRSTTGARPPLFDGVFLTHAHIGHYLGLAQLGREVYGARELPTYGSSRMLAFLRDNAPWKLLVESKALELREIELESEVQLADHVRVSALLVPHRDEFSDTLAFIVRGPRRALLYLPDIDKWERWEQRLEDVLARVDVALVDGAFYADGEIAGRSMAEIPHPFITQTLERLRAAPLELRSKVVFTHLNHTNPACDEGGEAQRAIRAAGMRVAREGELIEL